MAKKSTKKPKRVSKARVVDRLATMFGLDDYTLLEPSIQQVLEVTELPVQGVFVVWKPLMPGSLNFTVMGIPSDDPTVIQDAARALRIIADDLNQRALLLAMNPDGDPNDKGPGGPTPTGVGEDAGIDPPGGEARPADDAVPQPPASP